MTDYQALMTEWFDGILPPKKKRVDDTEVKYPFGKTPEDMPDMATHPTHAKRASSDEVINNIIAQWAGGSIPSGHPTEPPGENNPSLTGARAESLGMMTMARVNKLWDGNEYSRTLAQVKEAVKAEYATHTDIVDFVCSREFVSRFQE